MVLSIVDFLRGLIMGRRRGSAELSRDAADAVDSGDAIGHGHQ
jgi:hypothetical protein